MVRRKPSGVSGPVSVSAQGEPSSFLRIEWPSTKDQLEQAILNAALNSSVDMNLPFERRPAPRQNPENHFDFTVSSTHGEAYLDLMEVAPLDLVRGSFESAQARYHHGEIVDWLLKKILAKSKKYSATAPIHLLLYSTDWRFVLGPSVLQLLAHECHQISLVFSSILYFAPDDQQTGTLDHVFPSNAKDMSVADVSAIREKITLLGNPTAAILEADGSVSIPLGQAARGAGKPGEKQRERSPGVLVSRIMFEYPAPPDWKSEA